MSELQATSSAVELTPQCLAHVFSQLSCREAVRAAAVCKLWRDLVVHDEHLWGRHYSAEVGLPAKRGADGTELTTYRAAYQSWRAAYGEEYWPYLARAIRMWEQMKGWLASNHPTVLRTIRAGASEAQIAHVESKLGFKLPPALKVIYRLHDGQELAFDAHMDRRSLPRDALAGLTLSPADAAASASTSAADAAGAALAADGDDADAGSGGPGGDEASDEEVISIFQGLLGGYSVYQHLVVTRLMPLARAAAWTMEMQLSRMRPQLLAVACSFRVADKLFVADCGTGGVAVMRRTATGGPQLHPAAPSTDSAPGARDGVLRWLEEYSVRLAGGSYALAALDEDYPQHAAISLFPLQPPHCAVAVTRGVRVRASVVYCPEQAPQGKHLFAYSIRFSLQDAATQLAALPPGASVVQTVSRCQLMSRHWVIRDERGEVADEVRGEGVIGKYPLLEPDGPEFVYQSCTFQAATRGSMEGGFTFVEGSIERPRGGTFEAACPQFHLMIPAYIY